MNSKAVRINVANLVGHGTVMRTTIGAEQLRNRVTGLAAAISADYASRDPLLVGVLKGEYVFLADLSRAITVPHEMEFLAVAG